MFPKMIRMNIQMFLFVFILSFACGQDRKIKTELNPGCMNCTTGTTFIHIEATGATDKIHQIWDFSYGYPTLIFAIAGVNSTLNVTWDNNIPRDFEMNENPHYSFAMAIDKLIEYDDFQDNGNPDKCTPHRNRTLKGLTWYRQNLTMSDKEVMVHLRGKFASNNARRNDLVEVKLQFLPFTDYAIDLPHLIHTANSTLIDISLVNLTESRDYNSSRFAVNLVLVSTDKATDTMHYNMRKSLDDEHTPGVFEIIEVVTPPASAGQAGGFVQFRPVGYLRHERSVSDSTAAHVSDLNRTSLPSSSSLSAFYRHCDRDQLLVQNVRVEFGEPGDGFYRLHNYTAWSFTLGYGTPPVEGLSLFVILIISFGLGVPLALAASAACVVRARGRRTRNLLDNEGH